MKCLWRERIQTLTPDVTFAAPADDIELAAVEQALNVALPGDLRELLLETNGVLGEYDLGLVWPAERIAVDNQSFRSKEEFRELYMPFDHLLFFADAGNGDQIPFAILAGAVRRPDVYAWNHEDDSRTWVAASLATYLEWWLTGRIKL